MKEDHVYAAIDLKSFYASVECISRGLDPLDALLAVADEERSDKTICLAISPALKAYGIPGRDRLFAVKQRLKEVNKERAASIRWPLRGRSASARALKEDPRKEVDMVVAPPRMAIYMSTSVKIYQTYLRHVAPEDIHVYSIDEVFIDLTHYLASYKTSAEELVRRMIGDVYEETGITATAGIGTNLYLAKIAMDIMAKHMRADERGVRIAILDEMAYRQQLWDHQPISDFWRVGGGISRRLKSLGINTMGELAAYSLRNEGRLYKTFGVNAELLIDHAWGQEDCTMADIKAYKPQDNSLGQGQVLSGPYSYEKALTVIQEMAEWLALSLVSKRLVTDQVSIVVGYDRVSVDEGAYKGPVVEDYYGRSVPKAAHASVHFKRPTSSSKEIMKGAAEAFSSCVDPSLFVRRMYITALHVISEDEAASAPVQLDLFEEDAVEDEAATAAREKEKRLQLATLQIKERFGKNSLLRGLNYEEGATGRQRNKQIGGHRA